MRHVTIARDDFETLNRLGVADNVVEHDGPILLYPSNYFCVNWHGA
jgi:hypothetical protein